MSGTSGVKSVEEKLIEKIRGEPFFSLLEDGDAAEALVRRAINESLFPANGSGPVQQAAKEATTDVVSFLAREILNTDEAKRAIQEAIIAQLPAVIFAQAKNCTDMWINNMAPRLHDMMAHFPRRY